MDHVDTNALDRVCEAVPVRIYILKQGKITFHTPGARGLGRSKRTKLFVESLDLDKVLRMQLAKQSSETAEAAVHFHKRVEVSLARCAGWL